jgi:hypothetical protein
MRRGRTETPDPGKQPQDRSLGEDKLLRYLLASLRSVTHLLRPISHLLQAPLPTAPTLALLLVGFHCRSTLLTTWGTVQDQALHPLSN